MKKSRLILGLMLCICMVAGCAAPAAPAPAAPATPAAPAPAPATPAPAATPETPDEPIVPEEPEEPALPELDMDKLYAMLPIMEVAAEVASFSDVYTASDPLCFWEAMYLLCVNNGADHADIVVDGIDMYVRDLLVAEFASALFADYADIPPVPEGLGIGYDTGREAYVFGMSDGGPSSSGIENAAPGANGSIFVHLRLEYAGGEVVEEYEVELADNAYISGINNPTYYYTVVAVTTL